MPPSRVRQPTLNPQSPGSGMSLEFVRTIAASSRFLGIDLGAEEQAGDKGV